jgi:hypothetical protein
VLPRSAYLNKLLSPHVADSLHNVDLSHTNHNHTLWPGELSPYGSDHAQQLGRGLTLRCREDDIKRKLSWSSNVF